MDNTVGSREVIPRVLRARKNLVLKLSDLEQSILIGTVLGDGYITKRGKIQIEHGQSQKDYLLWKHRKLNKVVAGSIVETERNYGSKKFVSYRFWTRQFFRPWRKIFYPNGKKIVPRSIDKYLSPQALAVWYMDDGTLRTKKSIIISAQGFNDESLDLLRDIMNNKYDLNVTKRKSKRLYLGKNSTKKFVEIIKDKVSDSMSYKLP